MIALSQFFDLFLEENVTILHDFLQSTMNRWVRGVHPLSPDWFAVGFQVEWSCSTRGSQLPWPFFLQNDDSPVFREASASGRKSGRHATEDPGGVRKTGEQLRDRKSAWPVQKGSF